MTPAQAFVIEVHPTAEVFSNRISRSTTAYRIGIPRGPRAKIWLSEWCATAESAWGQAQTATQNNKLKHGT